MENLTDIFNVTNNISDINSDNKPTLKTVHDVLVVIILVAIMLAMGADITWAQLWRHVRRPTGPAVGMVCQFVIMPFIGFSLMKIFDLDGAYAAGVLIVSCAPGGAISNVFAYYCDGDLSLSVTMTAVSTLLAIGLMPLNLLIYGRSISLSGLVIPYKNLAISLAYVVSPALLGVLIKWKFPKVAFVITKIGSAAGILFIVVATVLEYFIYPTLYDNIPWKLICTVVIMPTVGFFSGFMLAWIFRQNLTIRKTIAIESGVQNVGISIAVISLSFNFKIQQNIILYPTLYAFSMMGLCAIICILYQAFKHLYKRPKEEKCNEYPMESSANKIQISTVIINSSDKPTEVESHGQNGIPSS